jgi:hypothetical protein
MGTKNLNFYMVIDQYLVPGCRFPVSGKGVLLAVVD